MTDSALAARTFPSRREGALSLDGVDPAALAAEFGTPLFVYSAAQIRSNYRRIAAAFAPASPLVAYSTKANTNGAVLRLLAAEGAGFDIVSGGELRRVLAAGVTGERIIFAGVGKSAGEMQAALEAGVLEFNLESAAEAERLASVAAAAGRVASVAIRVNPDVDAKTHAFISTGKRENKFGLALDDARALAGRVRQLPSLRLAGIHAHIGSQILAADPHADAARVLDGFLGQLKVDGHHLETLNFGGGFGITYHAGQQPLDLAAVASVVTDLAARHGLRLILEPGRCIVASAGLLLTRVEYVKRGHERSFVIVDAAMTELIRPALYQAHHEVVPVVARDGAEVATVDIVGPVCESADFIAQGRPFPLPHEGDLLAVLDAGAYCSVMGSNYNSRPRPAEVLVDNGAAHLVRQRESFDDLTRLEVVPDHLTR